MSYNTLFGKVPDDWTVSKIGEIAELRQGLQISTKKRLSIQEEGSIPLLKITDLPKGEFSEFVKDIPENYIATKDDIIYTRTGQVGLVYTNVEGCVHNNCFKVIVDYNKFDKRYIYYYLNSPQVRAYANVIASGSVQKDLTHKAFNTVKIGYPKLEKQKKIADILSSLDDKIELNNEMNKTLEEMAQSIFKRWFVDFEFPNEDGQPYKSSGGEMVESELGMIPKGWKVGSFSDISEILDSKRIPLSKREREKRANIYPYYGAASLMDYVDDYIFEGIHVLMGEDGTVIDKDGFPILQYVGGKFWVNNHAHVLKGKNEFSNEFVYLYLSNTNVTHLVTGAVQPKINQKNLTSLKLPIPDKNMTVKFNSLAKNIFEYIYKIRQENKKLEEIRSILLPVLMNGTINIK